MEIFLEILKYVIPSIVLYFLVMGLTKQFFKREENRLKFELRLKTDDTILPLRLQAYERILLLLERISPDSMIMRLNRQNMSARQLQQELLSAIRSEFEHNLSQQLYISRESWEILRSARSNLIQLINATADRIEPNAPSFELSKALLEAIMEAEASPTTNAIAYIKKEVEDMFF